MGIIQVHFKNFHNFFKKNCICLFKKKKKKERGKLANHIWEKYKRSKCLRKAGERNCSTNILDVKKLQVNICLGNGLFLPSLAQQKHIFKAGVITKNNIH